MKFIAVLFALVTLFANTVPCCGLFDHCNEGIEQCSDSHQDDHKTSNNCSPFYACGSCSGCILPFDIVENNIIFKVSIERTEIRHFKTITPFRILKCLWKPPRLDRYPSIG